MLRKYPKGKGPDATYLSRMGPFLKLFIAFEAALFGATFLVWYKMNRSRDFRYMVHNYCPSVLDMYYKVGEYTGDLPTRSLDYESWNIKRD